MVEPDDVKSRHPTDDPAHGSAFGADRAPAVGALRELFALLQDDHARGGRIGIATDVALFDARPEELSPERRPQGDLALRLSAAARRGREEHGARALAVRYEHARR
jgi:hypothetical protein